jgi:hypothetical protein
MIIGFTLFRGNATSLERAARASSELISQGRVDGISFLKKDSQASVITKS